MKGGAQQERYALTYMFCKKHKNLTPVKIRPRCSNNICRAEAVECPEPQSWEDLTEKGRIKGTCWNCYSESRANMGQSDLEYFVKCESTHETEGRKVPCNEEGIPISEVKTNIQHDDCICCWDDSEILVRFEPCNHGICFTEGCLSEYVELCLRNKSTIKYNPEKDKFSIPCLTNGCDGVITNPHLLKAALGEEHYERYRTWTTQVKIKMAGGEVCGNCSTIIPPPTDPRIFHVLCPKCNTEMCLECGRNVGDCQCNFEQIEKRRTENVSKLKHLQFKATLEKDEQEMFERYKDQRNQLFSIRSNRDTFTFAVHPEFTIGLVKKLIVKERGLNPESNPTFLFFGQTMDDNAKIRDYTLNTATVLHMIVDYNPISYEEQVRRRKLTRQKQDEKDIAELGGKTCPGCGYLIHKYWKHGCHHITCSHCKKQWFYICKGDWINRKCNCSTVCDKVNPKNCGCPICQECASGNPCALMRG